MTTYRAFGLSISSDIPLPELPVVAEPCAGDVRISRGAIDLPSADPGYSDAPGGSLLTIPGLGRFLIRGGGEIVVDTAADASDRRMRLFLLGSAFGALLHQRGLMPLHANAIVIDGRAFAFSGHSGAGKSTMAAWFHDRGHPILADDVCVIGFDDSGRTIAYPGIPRVRLWREALEASGRAVEHYERSFEELDKYDVPIAAGSGTDPVPLAAVYLLEKAQEGAAGGTIERLTGVAAVDALVSNTYRGGYLRMTGGAGPHLAVCARIATKVPVFRARRVWGFEAFGAEAAAIEAQARSLIGDEGAQGAR